MYGFQAHGVQEYLSCLQKCRVKYKRLWKDPPGAALCLVQERRCALKMIEVMHGKKAGRPAAVHESSILICLLLLY